MVKLVGDSQVVVSGEFSVENIFSRTPPTNSGYSACAEGYCDHCDLCDHGCDKSCDHCDSDCDDCYV